MSKRSPITLTFDDKDLLRRLGRVSSAVRGEAAEKGLRAAENFLIANIKVYFVESSGLHSISGNLVNSITEDKIVISKKSYVLFGPHSVYGAIHEFGGVIKPTNGPFLVFMGKDGKLVYTKSVTMPARPYMRPVLDRDGKEAMELMGVTIGQVIDKAWS